jgi:hypothetical protein
MRIVGYMKFHQSGTHDMSQRMMFPDADKGLGTWNHPSRTPRLDAVRELMR